MNICNPYPMNCLRLFLLYYKMFDEFKRPPEPSSLYDNSFRFHEADYSTLIAWIRKVQLYATREVNHQSPLRA